MKDLILLHGALGHSSNFEPYEATLSKSFKVHKILLQGHGGTTIPPEDLSVELYVKQLQQYIRDHDLKDVHLFGYSLGGYVVLCYAAQYPGKVASILTLAVKLDWNVEAASKETATLQPELLEARAPKYTAQLIAQHGEEHWKQLITSMAALINRLAANPLLTQDFYESFNIPIQIMVGDKDAMVSIEETLAAVKQIPKANIAVLPNVKHAFDSVKPDLLLSLMREFWKL